LLQDWSGGDQQALRQLTPLVYRELRSLAAAYLRRERSNHTLQPTALVHEAYLRMIRQPHVESHNRAQFFAIAANLMRQILVNHARARHAIKRGGAENITLQDNMGMTPAREIDLLALDESLDALERFDPRASRIVELRFFGGLTEEEIAEVLGLSVVTVKRDWRAARAMLYERLSGPSAACDGGL
jgi:RNA polymerase sigma factor (TIGR02999 family)